MALDVLVVVVVLAFMLILDMVTVYMKGWLYSTIASLIGFFFGASLLVGSGNPSACTGAVLTNANATQYPCIILNTYIGGNSGLIYDVTSPVIFVLIVGFFSLMSIILIFKYGKSM